MSRWLLVALLVPQDLDWPRTFEHGGDRVVVYDPQVDAWDGFEKLKGRSAVAVRPSGGQERFGVFEYAVDTETDFDTRQVLLKNRTITAARFSGVAQEEAAKLDDVLRRVLAAKPTLTASLDFLLAYIQDRAGQVKTVEVNLEPPPIYASQSPAILVMFLGQPDFKPVPGTDLRFAVNTNWDVVQDPDGGRYYLLHGEGWLSATDVRGPWTAAPSLPADFAGLPMDENWAEARKAIPGKKIVAPKVVVAFEPSELIVLDGPPVFAKIPGTRLEVVENTSSELFRLDSGYYFLTAGRWFRSARLEGPWSAATLPEDFARIPVDHAAARVRPSVPGTPEAADAVLLAAVPRKATINRKDVTLTVTYDGAPKFEAISTAVAYAVNSPFAVFKVRERYYCCHEAVWFESAAPTGPWAVCVSVPPEIYSIPPSHPKHYVTYTTVYSSTPDTVVVGYTAGYTGMYVWGGVVMFGMGMAIAYNNPYWHYHYPSHWYGYGCGAHYSWTSGNYYRGSAVYGPYGGAGFGAGYNPATGNYVRGAAAYGPHGSAYAARSYNPATGTSKARTGGSTPYGSWERGVAVQGSDWARGGVYRDERGAVAGAETSRGGRAVGAESAAGERAAVARSGSGDLYAGRDGEVYRKNESGWQKHGEGGWSDVDTQQRQQRDTQERQAREKASAETSRNLQRDAQARDRGTRTASQARSSGGGRGGGRGGGGRR
ncbi:MAG TPA: hypothetical protein VF950_15970 [Planctomycetota bacterium]